MASTSFFYNLGAPLCRRICWATFKFRTTIFLLYPLAIFLLIIKNDREAPRKWPSQRAHRRGPRQAQTHRYNVPPQAILEDPFRKGNNILVICDAYTPAGEAMPMNKRYRVEKIFSHPDVVAEEPWHGIEQEYTLLQKDVKWPISRWPKGGYPGPQGPY